VAANAAPIAAGLVDLLSPATAVSVGIAFKLTLKVK
jgi:hypothetical protein